MSMHMRKIRRRGDEQVFIECGWRLCVNKEKGEGSQRCKSEGAPKGKKDNLTLMDMNIYKSYT